MDNLLTGKETAAVLKLSPRAVFDHTKKGNLTCVRFGKSVRYVPSDIEKFINTHRNTGKR